MLVSELNLIETSSACPEQYDVMDNSGNQVGYLRLRHGYFAAHLYGPGGPEVYNASPQGDGIFEWDEREQYLNAALAAIAARL